jgi:hypothetical protein
MPRNHVSTTVKWRGQCNSFGYLTFARRLVCFELYIAETVQLPWCMLCVDYVLITCHVNCSIVHLERVFLTYINFEDWFTVIMRLYPACCIWCLMENWCQQQIILLLVFMCMILHLYIVELLIGDFDYCDPGWQEWIMFHVHSFLNMNIPRVYHYTTLLQ